MNQIRGRAALKIGKAIPSLILDYLSFLHSRYTSSKDAHITVAEEAMPHLLFFLKSKKIVLILEKSILVVSIYGLNVSFEMQF